MKQNHQHQAQRLYFQSGFTKSEIADTLGISRSTLDLWIAENHWDVLKQCSSAMPSALADNCYRIMARLTEHILSPEREGQPITSKEVNSLYKLSVTIGKLKTKATLSESMEMFAGFTRYVGTLLPELAASLAPLFDAYIAAQSPEAARAPLPANPVVPENSSESQLAQHPSAPSPSAPAHAGALPKVDLRKELRGTASSGPGKAWREKQASAKAAA